MALRAASTCKVTRARVSRDAGSRAKPAMTPRRADTTVCRCLSASNPINSSVGFEPPDCAHIAEIAPALAGARGGVWARALDACASPATVSTAAQPRIRLPRAGWASLIRWSLARDDYLLRRGVELLHQRGATLEHRALVEVTLVGDLVRVDGGRLREHQQACHARRAAGLMR